MSYIDKMTKEELKDQLKKVQKKQNEVCQKAAKLAREGADYAREIEAIREALQTN